METIKVWLKAWDKSDPSGAYFRIGAILMIVLATGMLLFGNLEVKVENQCNAKQELVISSLLKGEAVERSVFDQVFPVHEPVKPLTIECLATKLGVSKTDVIQALDSGRLVHISGR